MKITITKKAPAINGGGTWYTGWTGAYLFQAKAYDTGSVYGINGGKISKLTITGAAFGETAAHYDRGWDVEPESEDAREVLEAILAALN